eukprot:TRINITY_DN551_c0_g1_i5.p1 TRINITY_DN551_c0_g1~~TRINITY_DN551_c0_g1_i5.p1  ORF type:complete len:200 (-),score=26.14 TRINITY_DN551_c0_g1_i5:720-1319(-)
MDQLTRTMALELGPYGIRVNSVNPTVVMTAMGIAAWGDSKLSDQMKEKIPLGRFVEPSEVADTVLYLLSEKASMLNGVILPKQWYQRRVLFFFFFFFFFLLAKARSLLILVHLAVINPPSMGRITPFSIDAFSDNKYNTVSATSEGSTNLPSGIFSFIWSESFESPHAAIPIAVMTTVGFTLFTRIPYGPSSNAIVRVS